MINEKTKLIVNKWSNSFLRPFVPPQLLTNSKVRSTEDDGAKLVYIKFLYGVQTGTYVNRPFDGSSGNIIRDLKEESLWLYSLDHETVPEGFNQKKYDGGIIRTGEVKKCGACRGHGRVRCQTCDGKVRWTSTNLSGDRINHVCSCGDGKQLCSSCDGFSDVELVIKVNKEYKLHETKNSQYSGEVPEYKINNSTGDLVYEIVYDYPLDILKEILVGGINTSEYNQLNSKVLETLKKGIQYELANSDINVEKIYSQLDTVFESLANFQGNNEVLKYESMPIRVMVKVENSPVKQIDYTYNDKDYSIWIYGKANAIWKQKSPFTFNYKSIILSAILLLFLSLPFLLLSKQNTQMDYPQSKDIVKPNSTVKENNVKRPAKLQNVTPPNAKFESFTNGTKETMRRLIINGTAQWYYTSQNGVTNLKLGLNNSNVHETVFFHSNPHKIYTIYYTDCGFTLDTGTSKQQFRQVDPKCN